MRIILKIGYSSFLLKNDTNVDELLSVFHNITRVTEIGYGSERQYIITSKEHLELMFVPDEAISSSKKHQSGAETIPSKISDTIPPKAKEPF